MTRTACQSCEATTTDRWLCPNCTLRLRNTLHELRDAWAESETTLARQDSRTTVGRGDRTPLPINRTAMERRDETRQVIRAWASTILHGHISKYHDDVPGLIQLLLGSLEAIAHHQDAGEILDELADTRRRLTQCVDRRPDRVVAGKCGLCEKDLTTEPGALTAWCRDCDEIVDINAIRFNRVARALEEQITGEQAITLAASLYRRRITHRTLNRWVERYELDRTVRADGVPTYKASDVLERVSRLVNPERVAGHAVS